MNHLAGLYPYINERKRTSLELVDKVLKKDPYFIMAMLLKADLLIDVSVHTCKYGIMSFHNRTYECIYSYTVSAFAIS